MIITCVDLAAKESITVPSSIIDLITYPSASKRDIGRPIQVVFGNFDPSSEKTLSEEDFDNLEEIYIERYGIEMLGDYDLYIKYKNDLEKKYKEIYND